MHKILNPIGKFTTKYATEILYGGVVLGIVGVGVTSARAAVASQQDIVPEMTLKDKIRYTWPHWVAPVAVGAVTVTALFSVKSIHAKRYAALATVYGITDLTLREYQEKVRTLVGEKKETQIREEIAQDRLDRNPMSKQDVIITNDGDTLCYESWTGRYFKSDIEKLRKAENTLNQRIIHENYIDLNDLYEEIGLPKVDLGDYVGWDTDKLLEFSFTSKLAEGGVPCLVLDFRAEPRTDYYGR